MNFICKILFKSPKIFLFYYVVFGHSPLWCTVTNSEKGILTKNTTVDAHTRWPHENPSPTEKSMSRLGDNLMNATN